MLTLLVPLCVGRQKMFRKKRENKLIIKSGFIKNFSETRKIINNSRSQLNTQKWGCSLKAKKQIFLNRK